MIELEDALIIIEATIIQEEDPDYIEVNAKNGIIYVTLAKKEYKNMPLHERIQKIRGILEFEHDDVLDEWPVLLDTYDEDELEELLKKYGPTNE